MADVFTTISAQGVLLDDWRGRLPQLEFPAEYEADAEAP
jgi:hypothetical protein